MFSCPRRRFDEALLLVKSPWNENSDRSCAKLRAKRPNNNLELSVVISYGHCSQQ